MHRVRRDILGEPRATGLDGCAHCIGDRGYIFVFNSTGAARAARIPLNHLVGLSRGEEFAVTEIFPAERRNYGVYRRGEDAFLVVPARSVSALQIGPAAVGGDGTRPEVPAGVPIDKAFLTGKEVRERLGWPVAIPGEKS